MTGDSAYCFAADLGGTKLAAALADAGGRILAELTEPTDPRGGGYVAEQIATCANTLAKSARIEPGLTRHVMVGVPGAVEPRTGRISLIPNIVGLEDFDVLGYLRSRFGPHVAIENDVNLAMLGEQMRGCAKGCQNAAFLSLGTGAGLGLLIDNKLFRGARGAAGEIADLPIAYHSTPQSSPTASTFELEVGSLAIVDRYRRHGGADGMTVRDIFGLLEEGNDLAASVLDATARWVALAIVTLQSLLDLELIVFGGSIGVRPELYERVRGILPSLFARPVAIAPSQLGDRAGLIGAVCAAVQQGRASEAFNAHEGRALAISDPPTDGSQRPAKD